MRLYLSSIESKIIKTALLDLLNTQQLREDRALTLVTRLLLERIEDCETFQKQDSTIKNYQRHEDRYYRRLLKLRIKGNRVPDAEFILIGDNEDG